VTRIETDGLKISADLHEFVVSEALPGTGVEAADFFRELGRTVTDLAPKNAALLAKRDEMQDRIDSWHRENGAPVDLDVYKDFLRSIGYLLPEGGPVRVSTENVDPEIALIAGERPEDQAWAETLERSARKFGLKFGARKTWAFDADMRRNAAQEVPLFTQDLGDYDVLLVADAADDFARYISYNTWRPRPVAGSEGLRAVTWHRVVEQWGAAQLQSRFTKLADRPMLDRDYAAWAAVRAIGEAVTRTGAADAETLRSFMLSDAFELAGFKGSPLTFRTWNGQLRQPIPLVHERALVAQAPLEGFLHQRNELDTLGLDQPESGCTAFEN